MVTVSFGIICKMLQSHLCTEEEASVTAIIEGEENALETVVGATLEREEDVKCRVEVN
jgi:hypothetical protein